jgi:hypothetical protein
LNREQGTMNAGEERSACSKDEIVLLGSSSLGKH